MINVSELSNSRPLLFFDRGNSQTKRNDCLKVGWVHFNWIEAGICEVGRVKCP